MEEEAKPAKKKILFVCLGNICRSPVAEGIFRSLIEKEKLSSEYVIDSCGTGGWHVGEPPHLQMQQVAKKRGVSLEGLRARKVRDEDFYNFDLIVAMDQSNQRDLNKLNTNSQAKIVLLRDYDSEKGELDVPDPYYSGGFDGVFDIVKRCCLRLFEEINLS